MNAMKMLFVACVLIMCPGCNVESAPSINQIKDEDTVWVFAQFNIPEKNGTVPYFYYGKVSTALYEKIINEETKTGFILLKDARYWSNDEVKKYEDKSETGMLAFRIESMIRIRPVKGDPFILENKNTEPVKKTVN